MTGLKPEAARRSGRNERSHPMEIEFDKPLDEPGRFWLPNDPSKAVPGRFKYDPTSGITLELTAELIPGKYGGSPEEHTVIHGQLMPGTFVTIADAFVTNRKFGSGGRGPVTITANRALFGRHVESIEQMVIKSCSICLAGLNEWLGIKLLSTEDKMDEGKWIGLDVHYRQPPGIKVELPNAGSTLFIKVKVCRHFSRNGMELGYQVYFDIVADDSIPLSQIHDISWSLQCLMALMIGQVPATHWMSVTPFLSDEESNDENECFFLYHQRADVKIKSIYAPEMLLPYQIAKADFPVIVNKWFARTDQTKLATNIYFSSLLQQSPTIEIRFLAAMQAIESYHRSLGEGNYMEPKLYDAIWPKIAAQLPLEIKDDHRQSLKKRLEYGNEYSQRKRLLSMLDKMPEPLRKEITGGNLTRFVGKVVDTRNYFTHYDLASKEKSWASKDVINAATRLRILFVASIFHDLGLADEALIAAISRKQDFAWWLRQTLPL